MGSGRHICVILRATDKGRLMVFTNNFLQKIEMKLKNQRIKTN